MYQDVAHDDFPHLDVGDVVDLGPVQHGLHWLHTQHRMPQSAQPGQQPCNIVNNMKYGILTTFVVASDLQ